MSGGDDNPFTPKQMYPKSAALLDEIMGTTTEDVSHHLFETLLPNSNALITSTSVIHDNGCGTGAVTAALMATHPARTVKVYCTDSNQYVLDGCKARISENGWNNVTTALMRAQEITFPDTMFTHSFTNFVVMHLDDPHIAAGHLYRTLKAGGVCTVCTWKIMPHVRPVEEAHRITRGDGVPFPMATPEHMLLPSTLRNFLISGGFAEENIQMDAFTLHQKIKDLKHWCTILWSFLGARGDGWKKEDEEKWDEVIQIIVDSIEKSEFCKKDADGSRVITYVANIARATK